MCVISIICTYYDDDGIVPVSLFDYDWWKYNVQLDVTKEKTEVNKKYVYAIKS